MASSHIVLSALLLSIFLSSPYAQLFPTDTGRRCSSNTYDNGNFCQNCPPRHLSESGQFQCESCPPGETVESIDNYCLKCPKGHYVRNGFCLFCPYETYNSVPGARRCTPCPKGQDTAYEGSSSKSECFACGPGNVIDLFGDQVVCRSCDPGSYNSEYGSITCTACPIGTGSSDEYPELKSASDCPLCQPGTFSKAGYRSRQCEPCEKGMYSDLPGANRCKTCPSGSVPSAKSDGCILTCDVTNPSCAAKGCAPGTAPFRANMKDCRPCPAGTATTFYGTSQCKKCPKGLRPNAARNACGCAGKKVPNAADRCVNCPAGQTKLNATSCTCPLGQIKRKNFCFCNTLFKREGNTCVRCSKADLTASQALFDNNAANRCNICRPNFVYNAKAKTCGRCPPGTEKKGQNLSQKCKPCKYTHIDGNGVKKCGCGNNAFIKGGKCKVCKAGFEPCIGCKTCEKCDYGFYGDVPGLEKCKRCPVGQRYGSKRAQTKCPPLCPRNTEYSNFARKCVCKNGLVPKPNSAVLTCKPCPPPLIADWQNKKCVCPTGLVLKIVKGKATRCIKCKFPTVPNQKGTSCVCRAGFVGGAKKCKPCPPGTYGSQKTCKPCGPYTFQKLAGQKKCKKCPRGAFSMFNGGIKCVRCGSNGFHMRNGKCGKCKAGFRVRNGECVKCVKSISKGGNVSFCFPCKDGEKPSGDGRKCVKA